MNLGNINQRTTPVVLNLIIINALVLTAQTLFNKTNYPAYVEGIFALHYYQSPLFRPFQIVTHMFMHADLFHLLFNMLGLWMFGTILEKLWGPKRFLSFYLICGLAAAGAQFLSYAVDYRHIPSVTSVSDMMSVDQFRMVTTYTLGASGAVMGVLAAFGYLFPNTQLIIFPFPFPVKAKWAILGIIALDVFGGISRAPNDNIAHFAHVGGALVGYLIVIYWNKTKKQTFY